MMDAKQVYLDARIADANALTALASAKKALHQCRMAAKRVPKHARSNWDGTIKAAENRVAQAARRAEAAEAALTRAWGFYRASQQEAKARRDTAKAAHQAYKDRLKKAA